jgi:hypothetical protein
MNPKISQIPREVEDDMTDEEYWQQWQTLRQTMSVAQFVALYSAYSTARWHLWIRGDRIINEQMRRELRFAAGLPNLPYSGAELLDGAPLAPVSMVGNCAVQHVIFVATEEPVTLKLNGTLAARVTGVSGARRNVTYERLVERCRALGVKPAELIARYLENEPLIVSRETIAPSDCSTPFCKFPAVAVSKRDGKPVCRKCQEVLG